MVMELEKAVAEDEGRGELDALVAGAVLFVVYGWVRAGDLRQCIEEPELDLTEFVGFLETHFTEHKTARAGTKRAPPIACSADGLTSIAVGPFVVASSRRSWLSRRFAANGVACNGQVWAVACHGLYHARVLRSLQGVILRRGFNSEDLENVGAHSLTTRR